MDPRFEARPEALEIETALELWPELAGKTIRPLFVSAFGDIFVETPSGEILMANPLELSCDRIAGSVAELERLFANPEWAQEQLLTELLLLAEERGVRRSADQVFAAAPHPSFSGSLRVENLVPMNLSVWHHICAQIRGG
jgi:hypothetical protein